MSNLLHHVADRDACAGELRRVLRPGGLVLLRGSRRVSAEGFPFFAYFPTALAIDRERVPSAGDVAAMFAEGFDRVAHDEIPRRLSSAST